MSSQAFQLPQGSCEARERRGAQGASRMAEAPERDRRDGRGTLERSRHVLEQRLVVIVGGLQGHPRHGSVLALRPLAEERALAVTRRRGHRDHAVMLGADMPE